VDNPETVATAIRIGNPARWEEANTALRESNGLILAVSDQEILSMYRKLAQLEGVFCEPSSATGIAGLKRAIEEGRVEVKGKRVVGILTGHGLKDPDNAMPDVMPKTIDADMDSLMKELER
jgi:threonine synthase